MKVRTVLIAAGWSFLVSSIVLQVLYVTPEISWPYYILLFLVSTLSGMLIVDLEDVVLSFFLVLLFSFSIATFMLGVLPSITGALQSGFMGSDLVIFNAIMMVVKGTFPGIWVLCLLAGILGGGIGERIEPLVMEEDSGGSD